MYIPSLDKMKQKFARDIAAGAISINERSSTRVYIDVRDKLKAVDIVKHLFVEQKLRFSIATAVDVREGIEILYHMSDDRNDAVITVRALAEKPMPKMPSATYFMPAALWIEREIHEMMGVDFIGHPGLKRLLLPDDWPEGVYPQRKGE